MKMEFLLDSADDRPMIRLYDYRIPEIENLRFACRELAEGRRAEFVLHAQHWIEVIGSCQFTWMAHAKDIGVMRRSADDSFLLAFSAEGWREIDDKLEPFANGSAGFNWLTNEGDVDLLISHDGLW